MTTWSRILLPILEINGLFCRNTCSCKKFLAQSFVQVSTALFDEVQHVSTAFESDLNKANPIKVLLMLVAERSSAWRPN